MSVRYIWEHQSSLGLYKLTMLYVGPSIKPRSVQTDHTTIICYFTYYFVQVLYSIFCAGLSVVCGSINQTCTRGPYRGSQCTTMAVMANARAKMQKPSEWTTDTINDIIYAGDALHTHLR